MTDSHAHKLTLLSGMALLLQSCAREDELLDVVYWYLPTLFSDIPGRICLQDRTRQMTAPVFEWGEEDRMTPAPLPRQCQVLQKSIPVAACQDPLACRACCVPFKDKEQIFGALCLGDPENPLPQQFRGLALITAEYLALSVSNIRLHDRGNHQRLSGPGRGSEKPDHDPGYFVSGAGRVRSRHLSGWQDSRFTQIHLKVLSSRPTRRYTGPRKMAGTGWNVPSFLSDSSESQFGLVPGIARRVHCVQGR